MRLRKIVFWLCVLLFYSNSPFIFARGDSIMPVTPDASPEAVELLQYIYSISGKYTLTGQHCEPLFGSINLASEDYEQLLELAGDKPVALGEVGPIPTSEIIQSQPKWTWFMCWGTPSGRWGQYKEFKAIYESDNTLTFDELPWVTIKNPKIHYPVLK